MTTKPQENPTSTELLEKAQKALTPEQYGRIKKRALEKMNVLEMASMSLDDLKAQLPAIVSGDPEEHDIIIRLDSVFPGVRENASKKMDGASKADDSSIKFTEHPWDYVKQKTNEAGEWLYDVLVPDKFKEVREAQKKGSSAKVIAATALGGASAGAAVAVAEKAIGWIDRLKSDPMGWFKELFSVLLSFDGARIRAFFSGALDNVGLSIDDVTKFAEKWLPESMLKSAKSIFSIEQLTSLEFGKVEKIWKMYQKNGDIKSLLKLGIPEEKLEGALPVLEKLFSKQSREDFEHSLNTSDNIADIKLGDIIRQTIS